MRRTIIAMICALAVCSCKDEGVHGGTDAGTTSPQTTLYPLQAGLSWNYTGMTELKNFRPTVAGARMPDTSWQWDAAVQALGPDTLPDGKAVWHVATTETGAPPGDLYYATQGDTLLLYAYVSGSIVAPKPSRGIAFRLGGRSYSSVNELAHHLDMGLLPGTARASQEIIYEEHPPRVLVYPLFPGREWTYRDPGYPFHIGKKVVSGGVTIVAGRATFASRVAWMWDLDHNQAWDTGLEGSDQIGPSGLLKRTFIMRDVVVTNSTNPEGIGLIDMYREYTLH